MEVIANYCPFVGTTLNRKINYLHEGALTRMYNDRNPSLEELQIFDKSVSNQALVTES